MKKLCLFLDGDLHIKEVNDWTLNHYEDKFHVSLIRLSSFLCILILVNEFLNAFWVQKYQKTKKNPCVIITFHDFFFTKFLVKIRDKHTYAHNTAYA